jgi:tetratricopeptide (TPR) repeat protein
LRPAALSTALGTVLPLFVLAVPRIAPGQTLAALTAEVEHAERQEDWVAAAEAASRAVRLFPRSPLARHRLARSYARLGRVVDAIRETQAALLLDPRHVPSRVLLAELYAAAGTPSLAEAELREALRVAPGDAEAALGLARLQLALEAPGRAVEVLEAARKTHPADARILYLSGRAHAAAGDSLTARARLEAAVMRDSGLAPAWLALGTLLALAPEEIERARSALERAAALEPSGAEAHGALGALHLRSGDTEKALVHLGRAVELAPGDPESHYRLASALARAGREAEAEREREVSGRLRAAEEQKRREDLAFTAAFRDGQALAVGNRLSEAAAKLTEALRVRPDSDTANAMLAKVLFSRRDYPAAARHIARALETSPANGEYHSIHGMTLQALQDWSEAEQALRLAADLAPRIGDVFNQLGNLAARRQAWAEAVERYRRAVTVEPDEPAFHLNLANAYDALGRPEEAAAHRKRHRELTAAGRAR